MFLGAVRTAKGKHGSTTYLQDLSNVNGDCRVRDNVQSLCILYQDIHMSSLLTRSGKWVFGRVITK
jgi:hypothetical protein